MGFTSKNLKAAATRHRRYTAVQVAGAPTLDEFLRFIDWLAAEAEKWPARRVLVDLRGVQTMEDPEEQRVVGAAAGVVLKGMEKIASVVPEGRKTGHSEREAHSHGVALRVFTDDAAAIAWLLEA